MESDTSTHQQKEIAQPTAGFSTMRVKANKLDDLINLIGELVLERNRLLQLICDLPSNKMTINELSSLLGQSSAHVTEELQSAGLKTRMVFIETVFREFPRRVRDVFNSLKKEVNLVLLGHDTELLVQVGKEIYALPLRYGQVRLVPDPAGLLETSQTALAAVRKASA